MTEIPISRKPRIATRRKREVVVVTGATGMLMEVEIIIRVTMDVVIHQGMRSTVGATLGTARETTIAMAIAPRDTKKRVVHKNWK